MSMEFCKNCQQPVEFKYCPNCGQKKDTRRFTFHHLSHEFIHGFFHLDHGILFTAKELAIRPGQMLKNYLHGQRIRYFNPFSFILILGGLSAYLMTKIHWQSLFVDLGMIRNNEVDEQAWNSTVQHFTSRMLLSIPLYALVTKFLYFKKDFNFYEHIIANTYLRGEINFVMLLLVPVHLLFPGALLFKLLKLIIVFGSIIYVGWAYAGLFNNQINWKNLTKGILVAILCGVLELVILNLFIVKTHSF